MSLADLPLDLRDVSTGLPGGVPMDDMALLRMFVDDRSQEAFAEIVTRHADWIRAACRRSLRDKDLADDATQIVFIILARKAHGLPEATRVSGWLYRTTKFVISDMRKREMRHRRRYSMAMRAAAERGFDSSADDPAQNGTHEVIAQVLAALPAHERQAVAMHFLDGLTFREIGEQLGLSRDGAKKRVARALARLRSGFVIKSLALATTSVVAMLLRAPSTAQAVMSAGAKLVTSPAAVLKALGGQLNSTIAKLTIARAVTGGMIVATGVVCGTKLPGESKNSISHSRFANDASSHALVSRSSNSSGAAIALRGVPALWTTPAAPDRLLPQTSVTSVVGGASNARAPVVVARTIGKNTGGAGATRGATDSAVLPPTVNRSAVTRVNAAPAALFAGSRSTSADVNDESGSGGTVRPVLELPSEPVVPTTPTITADADNVSAHLPGAGIEKVIKPQQSGGEVSKLLAMASRGDTSGSTSLASDSHAIKPTIQPTIGLGKPRDDSPIAHADDARDERGTPVFWNAPATGESMPVDSADDRGHGLHDEPSTTAGNNDGGNNGGGHADDNTSQGNSGDSHGGGIRGTLGHVSEEVETNDGTDSGVVDSGEAGTASDDGAQPTIDDNDDKHPTMQPRGHVDPSGAGESYDLPRDAVGHGGGFATLEPSGDRTRGEMWNLDGSQSTVNDSVGDTMMQLLDLGHGSPQADIAAILEHATSSRSPEDSASRNGGSGRDSSLDGLAADDYSEGYYGQVVPEPTGLGLGLGLSIASLLRRRRRRV